IAAMTRVHAFVDDPKLKARLRETSGIGTEATRAGIIETLLKREYIERRKKELRATEQGVQLVQMLRTVAPTVVDPGTTAIWEDGLASIAVGRLDAQIFMQKQIEAVRSITRRILDAELPGMVPKASGFTCPLCQSALVQRTSRRGTPFFSCLGTDCHAAFFQEKDGKPGARMGDPETKAPEAEGPACLVCNMLTGRFSTAKGHGYYRCPQGHGSWWDDNGKLGKKWEDKPRSSGKSGRK
ncbi:MAG: DNA topoisomerase, partial [Acidithiobacillus sp.]|nr:DNA topoisomerase [Acidithiobacillus sp.]